MTARTLTIRRFGQVDYHDSWRAMVRFTDDRGRDTPDELWLLEHPPVYTLGRAGDPGHILDSGRIPVIISDRGGQVTYHAPGQLIAYVLLDLERLGLGVKALVEVLEQAVIDMLEESGVQGARRPGAPGVYVNGSKVAALGLRVRRRCTLHGLAVNVGMDLEPYGRIHPCGYPDLSVTQLADLGIGLSMPEVQATVVRHLSRHLAMLPEDASPGDWP